MLSSDWSDCQLWSQQLLILLQVQSHHQPWHTLSLPPGNTQLWLVNILQYSPLIGQNSLLQTRADIAAGNLQYDPSTTYISLIVGDGDNIAFMKGGRRGWMNERVEHCQSQPGARWILVSDWSVMRLFLNTWLWLVNYQFSTKFWPCIGLLKVLLPNTDLWLVENWSYN